SRNSNISVLEIATWRASATTRAIPMENIWVQKTVPPSLSVASWTVSSICRGKSVNSAKRSRTRRFRNSNGSCVSARTCNNRRAAVARRCNLDRQANSQLGRLRSLDLEVFRGRLPAVLDEFELNGLTLVQSAKSGAFNGRDV